MRIITAIIIALLITAGCDHAPQNLQLEVLPETIQAPMEGGEYQVAVSGPADWVTDNTSAWISISKSSGSASVTVRENPGADRQAVITFTSGRSSASLTVIQEHSDIFEISRDAIHAGYKGGEFPVEVKCHEPWTIGTCPDWITADIGSGDSPQIITLSVKQSYEQKGRSGKIEFICSNRVLGIEAAQDPSPYIAVEKDEVTFDGDGGNMQVLYISNTDVMIDTENEWIRLIETGKEEKIIYFEVMRNTGSRREGAITITSTADSEYSKTITVRQGEKIDHPEIRFEEGYSMDLSERKTFTLHPIFTDMSDRSLRWTSDSESVASVDQEGNVTVHTGGICNIAARNAAHGVSATIQLNIRILATSMNIALDSQDMQQNPTAVRYLGEVLTIGVTMSPDDAYTGDIVCISSDSEVAGIEGIRVRCISPGTATISVESLYHGLRKSFTLIILED